MEWKSKTSKYQQTKALIICQQVLTDFENGISANADNAISLIESYANGDKRLASLAMFTLAEIIS